MWSLRVKIAISAGLLAAMVMLVFASFSAWWFYKERLDIIGEDTDRSPTAEQVAKTGEETTELIFAYLSALPVGVAVSALGAWWLAGRLSKPLADLADSTRQIDARSLDTRLPAPGGSDEISQLVQSLNALLDRLERSFRQSSRFSADASHELRTPLAVMRAHLENAIAEHPEAPHTTVLVELLEENQRLASIAEKLLLLARADAGQLLPGRTPVDLSDLIVEVVEDFTIMAEGEGIALEGSIDEGLTVQGDAGLLRQLAYNLFDNALRHNIPGGWIRFRLSRSSAGVIFSISNTGSSIPDGARQALFERFFRIDESRSRSSGAGLGLSLCREIALAHGGELELLPAAKEFHEFIFRLS